MTASQYDDDNVVKVHDNGGDDRDYGPFSCVHVALTKLTIWILIHMKKKQL